MNGRPISDDAVKSFGWVRNHATQSLTASGTAPLYNIVNFANVDAGISADMIWLPATQQWRVPRTGLYAVHASIAFAGQSWTTSAGTIASLCLYLPVNGTRRFGSKQIVQTTASMTNVPIYLTHGINMVMNAGDAVAVECAFLVSFAAAKTLLTTVIPERVFFGIQEL